MHRHGVLELLDRYVARYPTELVVVDHIRQFVRQHPDCFERSCREGHITGSAWVVSSDHRQVLLMHHVKLERWLQLGGHADGETNPFAVALREAREESGMSTFREPSGEVAPLPLDLDVHRIPARGSEDAHLHFDLRYLLVAGRGQHPIRNEEAHALAWVAQEEIPARSDEESLLRMWRKAPERLASSGVAQAR